MSPSLARDSTAYRGVRGQPPSPVGPKPARSDQPLEETRTGDPEPRTRVPTKRDHLARAVRHRDLGALREHDPKLPVAHACDRRAEALQTTCAHVEHAPAAPPEGGSRAVHVGTATGSPAAAPERIGTEVPRHPDTALGGDEHSQPIPARPVDTSPLRRRHHRPSSHGLGYPMSPPDARDRVGRPDGCHLCSHRQRRPRQSSAPSSYPRGVHVRITTEAVTLPRAPRERAREKYQPGVSAGAPRHVISSAHLIRPLGTDRVDVAANPTSSKDPRFVAVSEPRLSAGPVPPRRSKPRLSGWSREPKSAIPLEMKPQSKPCVR